MQLPFGFGLVVPFPRVPVIDCGDEPQARGQPEPVPALKTEAAARQAARLVPAPSTAAKRDKDRDTAGAGKGSFACMAAEMTASPILSHPALTGPPATGAMRGAPAGVFPQWSQPQSSGEGSSMLAYPSTHAVLSPKMKRPAMPLLGDTGKEVNAREVSHKKRKVVVGMETKAVTVSWEDGGMGSETSFQSLSKSGFRDNELSLADTPCQRLGKGGEGGTAMTHTGCTPSQERSMPEMPASLVKQVCERAQGVKILRVTDSVYDGEKGFMRLSFIALVFACLQADA